VRQVETAFAAQGVRLQRIEVQQAPGLVTLRRPSETRFVEALITSRGARAPDHVVLNLMNGDTLSFQKEKRGNVTVFYARPTAPRVEAALASLH